MSLFMTYVCGMEWKKKQTVQNLYHWGFNKSYRDHIIFVKKNIVDANRRNHKFFLIHYLYSDFVIQV